MPRKYSLNENYFETIDTQDKAYWLGFLMGDGSVSNNYLQLHLKNTRENKRHIEKFLWYLSANYRLYYRDNYGYSLVGVGITSNKLTRDLINHGIVPRKTYKAIFPIIDEHLNRHFIRGLFDADGCFSQNKASFVGNRELMEQLEGLFDFLRIKSKIRQAGISRAFELGITHFDNLQPLYEYMYTDATIYLPNKHTKFHNYIKRGIRRRKKEFKKIKLMNKENTLPYF